MVDKTPSFFQCRDCPKSFSKGMDYNRHRKNHDKPFSCSLCGHSFSLKTGLERHRTTHQEKKFKFKCTFPNCRFRGTARKDHLWKHLQKKHRTPDMKDPERTLREYYNESLSSEKPLQAKNAANLELLEAAYKGDKEKVKDLILGRVDISTRDDRGRTAGHLAIERGHTSILRILLQAGIDLRCDSQHRSLAGLHDAARGGHVEMVKLLLENGADTEESRRLDGTLRSGTALSAAAFVGQVATAKVLLDHGAKIDESQWENLFVHGHVNCVRLLIDHEVDISCTNRFGATMLHLVAANHAEVVSALIERGAQINAKDYYKRTPLSYALGRGCIPFQARKVNEETAKLLLDAGAKLSSVDLFYMHQDLRAQYVQWQPDDTLALKLKGCLYDVTAYTM